MNCAQEHNHWVRRKFLILKTDGRDSPTGWQAGSHLHLLRFQMDLVFSLQSWGHIDSRTFSCLIPPTGRGRPLKRCLSVAEGAVPSSGVKISQPLTQISYPTHSPSTTGMVSFLQYAAPDLAALLHGNIDSHLCQNLTF